MKLMIVKNYEQMSSVAAKLVCDCVKSNPQAVLGLATGSTPIGMYEQMVADHKANGTSYAGVVSVNLDEYVGLDAQNEQSYAYFMDLHLFSRVDINKQNTYLPNGTLAGEDACAQYHGILAKFPRDLQVLGIGSNGHIGFNEPGTPVDSVTHVVKLAESTVRDNARLFNSVDEVPKYALSMGLSEIMAAKAVLLMASGANKAEAVCKTVCGEVSEEVPASLLQKHGNVTFVIDEEAASKLPESVKASARV